MNAASVLTSLLLLVITTPQGSLGETIRGITLSTHTDGQDWAHDGTAEAIVEIESLGANWVAIHPYAGIRGDGTVRFWAMEPGRVPDWIARPVSEAHAAGLKIMIKPHLAYWGSKFRWRGEIEFHDPVEADRFFTTYIEWITSIARVCPKVDAFVVGTELDATMMWAERWEEVVRAVKEVTDVPLTYAANWNTYTEVPFWDTLDAIGIQAYFPVAPDSLFHPSEETIREGWQRVMHELAAFSKKKGRHVVFTELGYNRSFSAAAEPWSYKTDGPEAEAFQSRCLRAALEAIEDEPRVLGSFLWKWFPNPRPVGRNFQLATPAIRSTIRETWGAGEDR